MKEAMLIESPSYQVVKYGKQQVKLSICHFVDGFLHLLRNFRQVLTSKNPGSIQNIVSRSGWRDTYKSAMN